MAWRRVSVVVPGGDAEALCEALEEAGAVSVELADADAGTAGESALFAEPGADPGVWPRCRLVALLPAAADAPKVLEAALPMAGCAPLEAPAFDPVSYTHLTLPTNREV